MIQINDKKIVHLSIDNGNPNANNEVYLVLDWQNNIIYKKPDSTHDGIIMWYKDSTKTSGINFVEYTIDQTTRDLQVVDSIYPYQTLPPFSDVIKDKNDILSFVDTTQQISCLDEWCFYKCGSLTSVNCPGVKCLTAHTLEGVSQLKTVNLSALTSYSSGYITGTKLTAMYVDSESYKSIDNGFGDADQLIIENQTSTLVSIVGNCEKLSCDSIEKAAGNALAYNHVLKEAYLWNLTSSVGSFADLVYGDTSLEDLYVDNSRYKTIPSNQNDTHRNVIVSEDGTVLYGILNYTVTCLSNNNITNIIAAGTYRNTSLLSVHISNGTYTTNADDTAIYTADKKTLVLAVKGKNISPSVLDGVEVIDQYAFSCSKAFNNLTVLDFKDVSQLGTYVFHGAVFSPNIIVYADNVTILDGNCQFYGTSIGHISLAKLTQITGTGTFTMYTTSPTTGLSSIDAPNLTVMSGSSTFAKCGRLKEVEFPELQQIGNNTFQECISLSSVSLPKCTQFGDNLFLNCLDADHNPTLKELTITAVTTAQATEMKDRICIPIGCTCHCSDGDIAF